MIFDPKIFYQTYQKDYHKIKATYLKKMLDNLPKYGKEFLGEEFDEENIAVLRRTLQSDLRQTYFHAIESFFELFFALDPRNKETFDDEFVLFTMTNSDYRNTYKMIKNIAECEDSLDFFDEKINILGNNIKVGYFLFYAGILSSKKFSEKILKDIDESIEAIKHGIKIIASDFIKREEYNAYKHGLRIIPAINKLMFADVKTGEINVGWDVSESMSFYLRNSNGDLTIVTKLFDVDRDVQLTYLCSNLIHHLIFYRRITMRFESDKNKFHQVPITLFNKELINQCCKTNVSIQDIVSTVKKVKTLSETEI